jgi:septum formation topological specificity factor MinE
MDRRLEKEEKPRVNSVVELNEIDGNLSASGLAQQTGVKLVDKETGLAVDELSLPKERPENLQLTPSEDLPLTLQVADELHSLIGLSELINKLREQLLELVFLDDKSEKRSYDFLPKSDQNNSEQKQIPLNPQLSAELLNNKKSIIDQYVKKQVRIELLLSVINQLPVKEYIQNDSYSIVREQLANWQFIINSIVPNLAKDQEIQELIKVEYQKQAGVNQEEIERLKKLISGERAGTDPSKVEQLKKRVLDALIKNTNIKQKESVSHDLSQELFETASLVNDWRIIDRFKREAKMDLPSMRDRVKKYQEQSQQHPDKSEELNKKLIEKVLIPITDTVVKLFPHIDDNSPSWVATALYRKEAICAGKAEILTTVFRLLGLKSQSVRVSLTLDDDNRHVVNLTTLLDKSLLVADANYPAGVEEYPDELEILKRDDPKAYEDTLRDIANGKAVGKKFAKDFGALVYQMKKISAEAFNQLESNKSRILNREGEIEYYQTEIPYPHQKIIRGEETPFSNHNNYIKLLVRLNQIHKLEHHYQESLRLSPHDPLLNYNYANFLSFNNRLEEALPYYAKAARDKDSLDIINFLVKYGDCLADFSSREEASKQYEEALAIMKSKPHLKSDFNEDLINSRIAKLVRW